MRFVGHVRSGRSTAICSWNGTYLWIGIVLGFWLFFIVSFFRGSWNSGHEKRRDEKALTYEVSPRQIRRRNQPCRTMSP
jgi:hypothetical protein